MTKVGADVHDQHMAWFQERLLLSVFPQHVAMEMKTRILTPHENLFQNVPVQKYESVRWVIRNRFYSSILKLVCFIT